MLRYSLCDDTSMTNTNVLAFENKYYDFEQTVSGTRVLRMKRQGFEWGKTSEM